VNKVERLIAAGVAAPALREGNPRPVKTVDPSGRVVRTVTSLAVAESLLARQRIELASVTKVIRSCAGCGKAFAAEGLANGAHTCLACRRCACGKKIPGWRPHQRQCLACKKVTLLAARAAERERRAAYRPEPSTRPPCNRCGAARGKGGVTGLCHRCYSFATAKKCALCGQPRPKRNVTGICGRCWPAYYAGLSPEDKRRHYEPRGPDGRKLRSPPCPPTLDLDVAASDTNIGQVAKVTG